MGFETIEKSLDLTGRFIHKPELEGVSQANYRYWMDSLNIRCSHTSPCWTELMKHNIRVDHAEYAPDQDHCQLYRSKDLKRYLFYQPYSLNKEKIHQWARVRGIKASIYTQDKSWHYPGSTWLVIMEVADEKTFKNYIRQHRREELWGYSIE